MLNNMSKRVITLFMYASGAQRQVISVLSHLGITESYSNLVRKEYLSIDRKRPDIRYNHVGPPTPPSTPTNSPDPILPIDISTLDSKIEAIRRKRFGTLPELSFNMRRGTRIVASTGLYGASYDNINMVNRSAEQILGRTGEVTSSTILL